VSPEIDLLAQQLAAIAARTTATAVADRIRAKRTARRDSETITELEEIVNELIDDKNELIRIAHAFEENLAAQRLSNSDVKYLTDNLLPIVTKLIEQSADGTQSEQTQAVLEAVNSLFSTEALTILQVIGFNFKRAIGEPLTDLVQSLISSRAKPTRHNQEELQALSLKRETLIYEIALDSEAHIRFRELVDPPQPAAPPTPSE
jgi:hypothetical protein